MNRADAATGPSRPLGAAVLGRAAALIALGCLLGSAAPLDGQEPAAPVESLEDAPAATALNFHSLELLDSLNGYAIPLDSTFLPGETVHVFFQIGGYSVGADDRVLLRYRMDALDPAGRRFYMAEGGEFDTELAPQDANWKPTVQYSPTIPQHAGAGSYTVRITVTDELAEQTIRDELSLNVDGDRVLPSDELLIRDFRFSKSDGGADLEDPVFGSGEQIWATFYITGYAMREDNTYDVESSAWVLDADGEELYAFESQGDAGSPYYARLWLPAKFRLDLEDSIPPGLYTVVLALTDRVGDARATERFAFRVQ